jgi:Holliday junction resolvase RusA-like endonuclease
MIRLIVPAPPSVNELFRNHGNRRVKTKKYNDWISECSWRIKLQHQGTMQGRYIILLAVERKSLAADQDNTVKPLIDILVKTKVIRDDKYVTASAVSWLPAPDTKACKAVISVYPSGPLKVEYVPSPDDAFGGWIAETQEDEPNDAIDS